VRRGEKKGASPLLSEKREKKGRTLFLPLATGSQEDGRGDFFLGMEKKGTFCITLFSGME